MILVLAATLGVASPALPLDKIQSALEQPAGTTGTALPPLMGPMSTAWLAGTSKGSFHPLLDGRVPVT